MGMSINSEIALQLVLKMIEHSTSSSKPDLDKDGTKIATLYNDVWKTISEGSHLQSED